MKKGEKGSKETHSADASANLKMDYQALLENTGIAIVIIDIDGKYIFANTLAANNMGCDVQEVVGKTMSDFLPQEIAQKYLERNRRLIKTGGGENYEASFDLPSGTKTFLINDQVLKDEQGNGFAIQSSSIDITERKETEKILAEKGEQYRLLIQNLPGTTVFLFDHDLRFILAEGQVHPKLGFTTESLLGKTLWEVLPEEDAKQLSAIYYSTLEGKATENYSSEYQGKSYRVNFAPVRNNQGKIIAGLVVSQDVTDRKKAEKTHNEIEERFRCVFESSNVPHSITSLSGEINVNQAFCEMFGYTENELKKKKWQEITFHEEIETDQKLIDSILKGERIGVRRVKRYVHKNGSILWGDVSYALIRDSEGNPLHFITTIVDITERKKAEDALRESEEKWHLLVETIPDYIALYDADGKYLFLNHFAEGFSAKDIEGKGYTDFLDEDSKELYQETFRKAKETKQTQYIEYSAYGDHYSIRNYESFFVPIFENNVAVNMLVIARDITERKTTEKRLAASQANARAIMESTDDVLVLLDKNGILIDCNEAHARRLNKTREELLGKRIFDELPPDLAKSRREAVNLCISTGECVYGEDVRFGRYIEFTVHPIFSEGGIVEKVAIFARDVTERKRTEEELLKSKHLYDDLVSKIKVGVYVLRSKPDGTFRLEYASPRMAELLGLSVDDLLSDYEAIFKAIHPEDLDNFTRLNQIGIQYKVPFDWKGRILVKGYVSWLHISSLPQLLENGDTFWHGLVEDITERLAIEAEMKLKNEELTNLNATKDKFFSIIAHDLKSPFNSILGLSEFMVSQIQEGNYEKIEEYADTIRSSSQRAMDLLQNLLEWSRVQTGRMVFSPENLKIDLLIHEALNLLGDSATQKGIVISRNIPDNLFAFVDQSMFSTIIRNLVSNAIKFSYRGGEIRVDLRELNNQIEVSVSDNGTGIKADQLENLFRIDQNQSKPGTQNEKGTGLGLILCKEFVEKHGGEIWAESQPGKGSKFKFTIPKI